MQPPIPFDLAALSDRIDKMVLTAERSNRTRIAALEQRVAELEHAARPWHVRLRSRLASSKIAIRSLK